MKIKTLILTLTILSQNLFGDDASGIFDTTKNSYQGYIPADVLSSRHGSASGSKTFIIGNIGLEFKITREYYSLSDEEYNLFPSIVKDHRIEISLNISKISTDLSKFSVDLTVRSEFLRNALSQISVYSTSSSKYGSKTKLGNSEAITMTTRYAAEIISCDGEAMNFGPKSSDIRDKIADLSGTNFSEYLGCTLKLKLQTSNKGFAPDPFNFSKSNTSHSKGLTANARGYFIDDLILTVGSHGIATLRSTNDISAPECDTKRPLSFSLNSQPIQSTVDRDSILLSANKIFNLITEYADTRAENSESLSTLKEIKLANDSAFESIREELQQELLKIRTSFSELPIQDQFLALSIIGRAYYYSDEVGKRINELIKNKGDAPKTLELNTTQ